MTPLEKLNYIWDWFISEEGYGRVNDKWLPNETDAIARIESFDMLSYFKGTKIDKLKTEGLSRINIIFPAIKNWDDLDLVRDQWLSVAPAARQATDDFQSMIDIFQAGKDAAANINALGTIAEVEAYDVINTPAWP